MEKLANNIDPETGFIEEINIFKELRAAYRGKDKYVFPPDSTDENNMKAGLDYDDWCD